MKIWSLSTDPHANGRSDEFYYYFVHKTLLEQETTEMNDDLFSNVKRIHSKTIKCLQTAASRCQIVLKNDTDVMFLVCSF